MDLIRRQEAIDALDKAYLRCNNSDEWDGLVTAKAVIYGVPSAQPERKPGKWLEREVLEDAAIEEWQSAKCSVCGLWHTTPYTYYFFQYNYCPNCGADMRGERDEHID